jgi:hypothetical protein
MKLSSIVAPALLGLALASPTLAYAQQGLVKSPAEQQRLLMKMDANKDNRISKQEYLAAMGAVFDKHAGAKGYCTPDEAMAVMSKIDDRSFLTDFNP